MNSEVSELWRLAVAVELAESDGAFRHAWRLRLKFTRQLEALSKRKKGNRSTDELSGTLTKR